MSGGSYNYTYSQVYDEYVDLMYDSQLNEMMRDLVEVLHDLEWWKSADIREESYRQTVTKFKKKWFKQSKLDIQKAIENEFKKTKEELLKEFQYLSNDYEGFEDTK